MNRIVVIPFDLIEEYINAGRTYKEIEKKFNPNDCFDEVYCLSPGGINEQVGKVHYINCSPEEFDIMIEKINPDVIRAYGGWNCCDWAIANRKSTIPVVVSVHDTNINFINQSIKFADYVICVSEAVKQAVLRIVNIDTKRVYVLPNRVDREIFYERNDNSNFNKLNKIYGGHKHIIHVGRKSKQKNLDTLIKAMQFLPKDYKAIFIGPGSIDEYEKLARKYDVEDQCSFVEHMTRNQLAYFYSWCDCMCTPSRWEGFGLVFIEAAACGSIIVTSNIAPMNEFLTDGVDAILVDDFENPRKIAKAIMDACNNSKRKIMKENAIKVGKKYDTQIIDEMEEKLYRRIISKGVNDDLINELNKEIKKNAEKIVIFGIGKRGIELLRRNVNDVAYIIDNDVKKIGQQFEGVKVITYSEFLKKYNRYRVVVTPLDKKAIVEQLRKDKVEYVDMEWYQLIKNKYLNMTE